MAVKFRLEDLPPHVLARIRPEDRAALGIAPPAVALSEPRRGDDKGQDGKRDVRRRKANATEAEYNRLYLSGAGRFETITLRLPGGSRYTPDWVSAEDGRIVLHEVKGGYRFHSQGRALTAFREASAAFPEFGFVWATKKDNGDWEIKRYA